MDGPPVFAGRAVLIFMILNLDPAGQAAMTGT
jgi:hypothetical protein